MSVLSVQAVTRRFADRIVFQEVSLRLAYGDRVGLVGPNGCGKSTLLRIAAGIDRPNAGNIALARGARVGFLEQETLVRTRGTVEEHARGAAVHLRELEEELRSLESTLASADEEALARYSDVQHHFDHAGGYDFDGTLKRVLGGLGLEPLRERPVSELSGGERTRLGLARVLLDDPDVLLLDEPTNHLDVAGLEWLERFLVEKDVTLLVSSHDRWFLDRVTARTLSFEDVAAEDGGRLVEYRGGYTRYAEQRAERDAILAKAIDRQAADIARTQAYIDRNRAGQRSKQARGRETRLAKVERLAGPQDNAGHGWRLDAAHLAGETVLEASGLRAGFPGKEIVRAERLRITRGGRIAVIGPNGAGKTTLVRTLIGDLAPLEGYLQTAPTARIAFLAQAQAELTGSESVLQAMRSSSGLGEQEARNLLARFLFRGDDINRSVGVLSGGERSRLALARLSVRDANLLVLDEPTNHLDLAAREQLERVLAEYEGTLLFVSHDRYFIDRLATEIWRIEDGELRRFLGNWTTLQRELGAGREPWELDRGSLTQIAPAAPPAKKAMAPAPRPPTVKPKRTNLAAKRIAELEERIKDLEWQMKRLERRLAEVAEAGDYLETKRVGQEHAELEAALKGLYEQWAADEEKA